MHKHLAIHHEDQVGNPEAFTFKSVRVFPNKCLDRKNYEGTAITANTADIVMNSSSEFKHVINKFKCITYIWKLD